MDIKKKVGIIYQPKSQQAVDLAGELKRIIDDLGSLTWICSAWEEEIAREHTQGTELLVCLGGDGTILRAARIANPLPIPILSVNLGRVGFMTELRAEDALYRVPDFVKGDGCVEERAMIEAELVSDGSPVFDALNDIVIGRAERCRLIRINVKVDGSYLTTYKCDGVILSTASGSTGYSLAAGGPILHPLARDILLKPVAAHLSSTTAIVLPPDVEVELEVNTTHSATLSIDGQIEVALQDGDVVRVRRSSHITMLLRGGRHEDFFGTLINKLEERE